MGILFARLFSINGTMLLRTVKLDCKGHLYITNYWPIKDSLILQLTCGYNFNLHIKCNCLCMAHFKCHLNIHACLYIDASIIYNITVQNAQYIFTKQHIKQSQSDGRIYYLSPLWVQHSDVLMSVTNKWVDAFFMLAEYHSILNDKDYIHTIF